MKRIVSILLSCTIILGLTACRDKSDNNRSNRDDKKEKTTVIATDSVSDTVKDTVELSDNKNKDINLSFDEVIASTVAGFGYDYRAFLNIRYMTPSTAESNKLKGINNFAYIWHREIWTDEAELKVEFYIFEFDTSSNHYKNIEIGKSIKFDEGDNSSSAVVTAVNGQYVLSIFARETSGSSKVEQSLPDFTIGTCQRGYETFLKLKSSTESNTNTGKLNISLKDITRKTGEVIEIKNSTKYPEFSFMQYNRREQNAEIGIKDYCCYYAELESPDDEKITFNFYIFELDLKSEQYKKLTVGGMIFYYMHDTLSAAEICAINNQYVLCIDGRHYKNNRLITEETMPDFTLGNTQKAYESFISLG